MYIAICDDQEKELAALESLLSAWQKERQHPVRVKIFRNAVDLLDAARRENFTLYLLDVLMPGMNGMVAAREIRQFDAAAELVFLTATPTFAYESYSVHALEYLLKPEDALPHLRSALFGGATAPGRADSKGGQGALPHPLLPAGLRGGQPQAPVF